MSDTILRPELANDPQGRGYAGMTDQQVLDDLNLKRIDNWVTLTAAEIFEALDAAEFTALTNADEARVDRILSLAGDIQTAPNTKARNEMIAVFGGGSQTIANLAALANQQFSRAEQLGIADWLTLGQVNNSRS